MIPATILTEGIKTMGVVNNVNHPSAIDTTAKPSDKNLNLVNVRAKETIAITI